MSRLVLSKRADRRMTVATPLPCFENEYKGVSLRPLRCLAGSMGQREEAGAGDSGCRFGDRIHSVRLPALSALDGPGGDAFDDRLGEEDIDDQNRQDC